MEQEPINNEKSTISLEELIDLIIDKDNEHAYERYQGRNGLTLPDPITEYPR